MNLHMTRLLTADIKQKPGEATESPMFGVGN
jgi:hypothetical protein